MGNWIKIYEEVINELTEKIEDYTSWINEILKDNAIPFKNRIDIRDERNNILEFGGCTNYLEVYVPKEYEKRVIELLEFQEESKSNDGIEFYLKENEIRELENFENEKEYIADNYTSERPSEEYIDKMKKIEKTKENKFWIFLGTIFFMIIIGTILVYFSKSYNEFFGNFDMNISVVIIIFSVFLLISILLDKCLTKHIEKAKERIKSEYLVPIIKKSIYPYQYSTKGITEEFFRNTFIYEEFDHYNIYKSYDKITGIYKEREILASNLYLKYEEFSSYSRYYRVNEWERLKNDTGNFFDGIFIKSRISNTINSRIYIEPIKWWDNCKNYMEYCEAVSKGIHNKKYYLNSANIKEEFENNFRIYEMGEQKNSEMLNEKFMENILKLKEKYNKDISICIANSIANIMINDTKLLDEKMFIEQGLNAENVLKSINLVEEVIDIVKDFDIIEKNETES